MTPTASRWGPGVWHLPGAQQENIQREIRPSLTPDTRRSTIPPPKKDLVQSSDPLPGPRAHPARTPFPTAPGHAALGSVRPARVLSACQLPSLARAPAAVTFHRPHTTRPALHYLCAAVHARERSMHARAHQPGAERRAAAVTAAAAVATTSSSPGGG